MRRGLPALVGAVLVPAAGLGASLPGHAPTAMVFAGPAVLVSQTGPVVSGRLRYDRTDVWRVSLALGGKAGAAERLVTVRTSAGNMRKPLLSARPDGAFALVATGAPPVAPSVIWCCDPVTHLQEVVESEGRPGARMPAAIWLGDRRVRYVTIQGADARLVDVAAVQTTPTPGIPMSVVPASRLVAIGERAIWWVPSPQYGSAREVLEGREDAGVVRVVRRGSQPGIVRRILLDGNVPVVVLKVARGFQVRRLEGPPLWVGPAEPVVAGGGGRVVVADGRRISAGSRRPLQKIATVPVQVRAIAIDATRVAWASHVGTPRRPKTDVRWVRR